MNEQLEIVELEARNSLDFLEEVFALYGSGTLFAICREGTNLTDYPALRVSRRIATGPRTGWASLSYPAPPSGDGLAQVAFSSGTEGKPKAILLSHRALADVEDRLLSVMEVTGEIREYIGVPVTYSFGLGRARVVARAGGAFYLPENFNPAEIKRMLEAGEINAISAVPSLWRILLTQPGYLGELGARVRWIEIGSQYMSGAEKTALRAMFPRARIVQHYGLTEASRSTFLVIDNAESESELESVGTGVGATEVRIGHDGEICIRGPHLANGILCDDGSVVSVTDAEGWLHTADRGEISDGWLYYRGRLDDQINLSGVKLAAEALERRLGELVTLGQSHFAVTSVADPMRGEIPLLVYDATGARHAELLRAGLIQVLSAQGIEIGTGLKLMGVENLPRTGSGKVQRKKLRALWEAHTDRTLKLPDMELTPDEARIAETWRSVLGPVALAPGDSFYDIGGDSLAAMQIGLAMEAHFPRPTVRATLEGRTLAEAAASLAEAPQETDSDAALPPRTIESWALNLTRGVMVISVLMSHWMPGVWERLVPGLGHDPLAFISRMGTPGFAFVFGLGVSYFMLHGYPGNLASVRRRMKVSLALVGVAFLLLGLTHMVIFALEDQPLDGLHIAYAFYNVLGFYLLALLTLPIWLRALAAGRAPALAALTMPLLWLFWCLCQAAFGASEVQGLLEWLRLMLVGQYAYAHMMPMVLAGILVGLWMQREPDPHRFARQALLGGGALMALMLILMAEADGISVLVNREALAWSSLSGAFLYSGFTTMFLGLAILVLYHWSGMNRLPRLVLKGLILFGSLALPVYATHQLVLPAKELLTLLGFSGAAAITTSLGFFFVSLAYGIWRLNKMYFR